MSPGGRLAVASRWLFHRSVQTKILALVLGCVLVPLLFMGYFLKLVREKALGEEIRSSLDNQLFRKATTLDGWFRMRISDVERWSASFVVYEGIEALAASESVVPRSRGELKEYLESVLSLGRYRWYESLFLVDLRGDFLAGTRPEELDPWAKRLLSQTPPDTTVVSPLLEAPEARPSMLILEPIKGRSNAVIGYLVARLDLRELGGVVAQPIEASPSMEADLAKPVTPGQAPLRPSFWLVDLQGRVVGRDVEASGEAEHFPVPLSPTGASQRVTESEFPKSGKTLFGSRRLDSAKDLLVAATVPAKDAYARPVPELQAIIYGGLAVILLTAIVSYVASRGMLRPILLLSEGAKRVSAGDLNVYLPVWGRDEIADLTRAFNEMARKVREGRQSLEEARDELSRTNEGLKAANRTLETLAITDGLTGLYNHRHFQDTIEKEIRRCDRDGREMSLLLLDLDHFKQFNDRFGHTEGDAALRRVAGQVMKSIRSTDLAFRYGGEELAVVLPSCSKQQAAEVAEKIRVSVGRLGHRPGRFGNRTTVSIGVATFPEDGRVARGLVDFADAALYTAKAMGRDRVSLAGSTPPSKDHSTVG